MVLISDEQLASFGLSTYFIRLWGPLIRSLIALGMLYVALPQFFVYRELAVTTLSVREMGDFRVFYESGQRLLKGMDPYRGGHFAVTDSPNLNPPHFVLFISPIALLPKYGAFAIWATASVFSAIIALSILFKEVGWRFSADAVTWTFVVVVCAAATGALLHTAQIGWLLWGPTTCIWSAARNRRWNSAAVSLGLTMSIKPFVGLLLLPIVRRGGWRPAFVAAGTASACYLIGTAVLGYSALISWIQGIRAVTWAGHVFNSSLYGYLTRLLGNNSTPNWHLESFGSGSSWIRPLWLVGATSLLVITSLLLPPRKSNSVQEYRRDVDREFVAVAAAALLITPLGWIYYHFLFAAPFVSVISYREWRRALEWRVLIIVLAIICLSLGPGQLTKGQPNPWATATVGSAYFWALFGIWVYALTDPTPRRLMPTNR